MLQAMHTYSESDNNESDIDDNDVTNSNYNVLYF